MALMPSNLAMKSLMEPFSNDGEEHLKDLATRVRIYKTTFAAWETLHQSSSEGVIGKQNIVQLLRESQDSVQNVNAAIQNYDNFRSFIGILGSRLFPGTKLLGDHLALHAGFRDAGRGMVLTFNEDQTHMVLTSIRSLRKLGSTMPVEVMYYGEGDLGQEYRELLEEIPGVVTRDMSTMVDDVGWELRGWALKPWAMLMSSFQEVLFMDADVLFFANPEILFEDPQYLETGALFFKDRNLGREDKRKWLKKVLPLPISNKVKHNRLWTKESGHMQDSGVVLVDKWRHFVPLLLTARLNGIDRDTKGETGKKGVYEMVYGDKETFWLSWEMAGVLDYAFHNGSTGILGVLEQDDEDKSDDSDMNDELSSGETHQTRKQTVEPAQPRNYTSCSPQLLHLDAEDKPLWLNGWIAQSKFSAPTDLNIDSFEVFMKEPPRKDLSSKKEIWQLKQDNICCLTSGSFTEISDRDKQTLEMMISFAQEYVWEP
ncbi:putative alpha-1,3-mannosyltransferase [Aureobasidium sp. EXF-10728]|nr:putative alpha-1,3-mannosyltransferase [Aureobasidium sp. EXF-10728]